MYLSVSLSICDCFFFLIARCGNVEDRIDFLLDLSNRVIGFAD